jgi:hypothetical protein
MQQIKKQMNSSLSRGLALYAILGLNHAISLEAGKINLAEVENFSA